MLGIASETYSCASVPTQHGACQAYIWDNITKDYLAHQRRILSLLGTWSADRLREAGISVHRPEGAFYLFPDFSLFANQFRDKGITSSQKFCEKLMQETGVVLLPGDAFGMPPDHLSARLAYVEFNGTDALAASERIGLAQPLNEKFLHQHLEKNARGVERLCSWIEEIAGEQDRTTALAS